MDARPIVTADDPHIVRARSLAKSYRNATAVLSGIDLDILPRERVALIGANGSGKSTLLKCMIGLHPISEGSISTLGETFSSQPNRAQGRRLRRQIGFVFQHHGLVKRLSVLSNVVHGMLGTPGSWRAVVQTTAQQGWRDRAMDVLDSVNLADKALERADSLSGGQQQRVAIARALIRQPNLMIADEPAASLDPSAGHEVMGLFSNLVSEYGITLVFTSHDMRHARDFSDRMIALKNGGVWFDRPTHAVTDPMIEGVFDG